MSYENNVIKADFYEIARKVNQALGINKTVLKLGVASWIKKFGAAKYDLRDLLKEIGVTYKEGLHGLSKNDVVILNAASGNTVGAVVAEMCNDLVDVELSGLAIIDGYVYDEGETKSVLKKSIKGYFRIA